MNIFESFRLSSLQELGSSACLLLIEAYRLFLPLWRPVIKHELGDVARTLAGAEQVLPGLAAHEDQA